MFELFDYQKKLLTETITLLNTKKRCILNVGMGLGKTILAIKTAQNQLQTKKVDKVLIIAPKNKQHDFLELINQHQLQNNCLLTTYQKFMNNKDYQKILWQRRILLIVDEAQAYKNYNTKRTKFMVKNAKYVSQILLMSGNLISTGYINLLPIYQILELTNINYYQFLNEFCFTKELNHKIKIIVKYKDNIKNFVRLGQNLTLTLKTNQTNLNLPEEFEHIIKINDPTTNRLIRATKSTQTINNLTLLNTSQTFAAIKFIAAGYQPTPNSKTFIKNDLNPKLDHLLELIDQTDNNIVIFTNFIYEREMLIEAINQKYKYINVINHKPNQQLSQQLKNEYVNDIQNIFIANIFSAGTGIDGLQNYDFCYCLYYTLPNSYEIFEQSKKRIHRINQKNSCHYYYLIGNIYDDNVFNSLQKKQDYTLKTFELLQ